MTIVQLSDDKSIFDRTYERAYLTDFLTRKDKTTLLVAGRSGAGKSVVVNHALCSKFDEGRILRFSFKSAYEQNQSLSRWLEATYKAMRPNFLERYFKAEFKDLRIAVPGIGVSLSYSASNPAIDSTYCETFLEAARHQKVSAIVFENIELCLEASERSVLRTFLMRHPGKGLKVIVEKGSLPGGEDWLDWHEYTEARFDQLSVDVFNKTQTEKLFQYIHHERPPHGLFNQTCGIALCIAHYRRANIQDGSYQWVIDVLKKQSLNARSLLRIMGLIGTPTSLERFARFGFESQEIRYELETLSYEGIVEERSAGFLFKHPVFQVFLASRHQSAIDQAEIRALLDLLFEKGEQSYEDLVHAFLLFEKVGSWSSFPRLSKALLPAAIRAQDYGLVLKLTSWMLEQQCGDKNLLLLIRIQSLIHSGDADGARRCLSTLQQKDADRWSEEKRLVRSFVLYAENRFGQAIENARPLVDSNSLRTRCITWAHMASNAIALGAIEDARDYFTEALKAASTLGDQELILDCGRIAARILPPTQAQLFLMDLLNSGNKQTYSISRAKLQHTCGTNQFMFQGGQHGEEAMLAAKATFDQKGSALSSHSCIGLGLQKLACGDLVAAKTIFLDGLNVAFEELDKCALFTNLTLLNGLQGNFTQMLEMAKNACEIAGGRESIHEDAILENARWHNLALSHYLAGNRDTSLRLLDKLSSRPLGRWKEAFEHRRDRLVRAIELDQPLPVENEGYSEEAWFVERYNVIPMLLSFYGFKVDVINADYLD